jgi:anthranilate phosphoribosyltransferase
MAAVVLNAAAALYVSNGGPADFGDAIAVARAGLKDGAGLRALERLRKAYRSATP